MNLVGYFWITLCAFALVRVCVCVTYWPDLTVHNVTCVGLIQIYAISFMLCCWPWLCLHLQFPIHMTGQWGNILAGRTIRLAGPSSAQLCSVWFNSVVLMWPCEKSPTTFLVSAGDPFLDLPLAPEKLEALISLGTGVQGFLFALAAFQAYQRPRLPLLSLPAWPLEPGSPPAFKIITLGVIRACATFCMLPPTPPRHQPSACMLILWQSSETPQDLPCLFALAGEPKLAVNWGDPNISIADRARVVLCESQHADCSSLLVWIIGELFSCPCPHLAPCLCEFRCVMTWLLPLINDMWRSIHGRGAEFWSSSCEIEMLLSACTRVPQTYSKYILFKKQICLKLTVLDLNFQAAKHTPEWKKRFNHAKPQFQEAFFFSGRLTHFSWNGFLELFSGLI